MPEPEHPTSFWIQKLKSQPKIKCHECKRLNMLSAKPGFFQKVICESCKTPLSGFGWRLHQARIVWGTAIFILPMFYLLYLLITAHLHPWGGLKSMIRSHYDKAYGAQSQQKLMNDWGWLYRGDK